MKRSTLQRRTPLKRGRRKRAAFDRTLAQAWHDATVRSPCAVCGARWEIDGHHALKQQWIVPAARRAGLDIERVRWSTTNLLPLCRRCHSKHHSGMARVPREVLNRACPELHAFADALGLAHLIDREYPKETP